MWLINKENKDTFNMNIYITPAWKNKFYIFPVKTPSLGKRAEKG